jgi:hypothetical protein
VGPFTEIRLVVEPGSDPNSVIIGTALAREHQIDTVVVDFNMPDLDRKSGYSGAADERAPRAPCRNWERLLILACSFSSFRRFRRFWSPSQSRSDAWEFGKGYVCMEVLLCSPDTGSQWVAVYLLNSNRQSVELTLFTHAWSARTAMPFGSTSLETGASCVILVNCCRSLCSYSAI